MRYAIEPFDTAVSEVSGDALVACSSKPCRVLVVGEEDKGTSPVQVQRSLQGWKQRQESLSEAGDGSGLVGDEVAAVSEKKLQFGDLFLTWSKLTEVWPHPSLVGDNASIAGIGFGLTAVGVAGSVYGEARDVKNPLIPFP